MSNPHNRNAAILSTTLIGSLLLPSQCRPEAGTLHNDGRDEDIEEQTGNAVTTVFSGNRNHDKVDESIENQSNREDKLDTLDKPRSKLGSNADQTHSEAAAKTESIQIGGAGPNTDAGRLEANSLAQIAQHDKEKLFGKEKEQNWWSNVAGAEQPTVVESAEKETSTLNNPDNANEVIVTSSRTLSANKNDHVQRQNKRTTILNPLGSSGSFPDSFDDPSKDSTSSPFARSKLTLFNRIPPLEFDSRSGKSVVRNQAPTQSVLSTTRLLEPKSKSKIKGSSPSKSQPTTTSSDSDTDTSSGSSKSKAGRVKGTNALSSQGSNKSSKDKGGAVKLPKFESTLKSPKSSKSSKLDGRRRNPTANDSSAQPTIPATTLPTTSAFPTTAPSEVPSTMPSVSDKPSSSPSQSPTDRPSSAPSQSPSVLPSAEPTTEPSSQPSGGPTKNNIISLASCKTGTDEEVRAWCAEDDRNCCCQLDGACENYEDYDYAPCTWETSNVEVCENSCNAYAACYQKRGANLGSGIGIGAGSCNDFYACAYIFSSIGDNACNAKNACRDYSEPAGVADGTCNEYRGCTTFSYGDCKTGNGNEVTQWCSDNQLDCCCQGAGCDNYATYDEAACYWEDDSNEVCIDSCNGNEACYFRSTTSDIKVGIASCNGLFACTYLTGSVGDNACNGEEACLSAGPGDIPADTCNGDEACSAEA